MYPLRRSIKHRRLGTVASRGFVNSSCSGVEEVKRRFQKGKIGQDGGRGGGKDETGGEKERRRVAGMEEGREGGGGRLGGARSGVSV